MTEHLLSPSTIKLFGRILDDLSFAPSGNYPALGGNTFLQNQMNAANPELARIYGFSFEGT